MDLNQRFMYPQIARSGRFDAAMFGTSTVRLLDPARARAPSARGFANLGMNAGTPWEQLQLADLFLRRVPQPNALIFGIDATWCEPDADGRRLTPRAFPPWLYDDEPLNDYPALVNLTAVEIAGRVALHRLGLMPERIRADGYEIFVPDDALYDLARARTHLGKAGRRRWRAGRPSRRRTARFPGSAMAGRAPRPRAALDGVTLTPTPVHAGSALGGKPGRRHRGGVQGSASPRSPRAHGAAFVDFRLFARR